MEYEITNKMVLKKVKGVCVKMEGLPNGRRKRSSQQRVE